MREPAENVAGSCAEAAKIGLRARESCAKPLNYFHFRRCANHARDYGILFFTYQLDGAADQKKNDVLAWKCMAQRCRAIAFQASLTRTAAVNVALVSERMWFKLTILLR